MHFQLPFPKKCVDDLICCVKTTSQTFSNDILCLFKYVKASTLYTQNWYKLSSIRILIKRLIETNKSNCMIILTSFPCVIAVLKWYLKADKNSAVAIILIHLSQRLIYWTYFSLLMHRHWLSAIKAYLALNGLLFIVFRNKVAVLGRKRIENCSGTVPERKTNAGECL